MKKMTFILHFQSGVFCDGGWMCDKIVKKCKYVNKYKNFMIFTVFE